MTELREIGERLRAYRLGAGVSIDDMARKLNMSRATAYRLEKDGVNRLDVLERVARLLGVSVASLLGVDIEYTANAVTYFERLRQLEHHADWNFVAFGPISYLLTTTQYDRLLRRSLIEQVSSADRAKKQRLAEIDDLMSILAKRKAQYLKRRPAITNVVSASDVERFARHGLVSGESPALLDEVQRDAVVDELSHIANLCTRPPFGVQIGVLFETLPTTGFSIMRMETGTAITVSPFRIAPHPNIRQGVAMITTSAEAVQLFTDVANGIWEQAVTGQRAADFVISQLTRMEKREKRSVSSARTK